MVPGHESSPDSRGLHHWSAAAVQSAGWPFARPEEAVSVVSGPHAVHRGRGQDRDQGMPVSVQAPPVELQHRGQLVGLRQSHANREPRDRVHVCHQRSGGGKRSEPGLPRGGALILWVQQGGQAQRPAPGLAVGRLRGQSQLRVPILQGVCGRPGA